MDVLGDTLAVAGTALLLIIAVILGALLFGGLIWLAIGHLNGKRTPFDGLFSGIGRANAMNSHLQAGTPHPDDLAVPVPPAPGSPPRARPRRDRGRRR